MKISCLKERSWRGCPPEVRHRLLNPRLVFLHLSVFPLSSHESVCLISGKTVNLDKIQLANRWKTLSSRGSVRSSDNLLFGQGKQNKYMKINTNLAIVNPRNLISDASLEPTIKSIQTKTTATDNPTDGNGTEIFGSASYNINDKQDLPVKQIPSIDEIGSEGIILKVIEDDLVFEAQPDTKDFSRLYRDAVKEYWFCQPYFSLSIIFCCQGLGPTLIFVLLHTRGTSQQSSFAAKYEKLKWGSFQDDYNWNFFGGQPLKDKQEMALLCLLIMSRNDTSPLFRIVHEPAEIQDGPSTPTSLFVTGKYLSILLNLTSCTVELVHEPWIDYWESFLVLVLKSLISILDWKSSGNTYCLSFGARYLFELSAFVWPFGILPEVWI
ncbi:hypothetical protein V6N13_090035 [Hibiscus sabdariffa]|uniref:Uncharacterized protein n=1 Tax=Hibiscus sabdariffa TaxID=183260 RepID=A0ABR2QIE9_9ROSI